MKLLKKIINRLILILFLFFTPFIFFLVKLVSVKVTINFGILNASRIGNLAAVSELYLCEKKLIKKNKKKIINIIAIQKPICNNFLLKLIKRKIFFFPYFFVRANIIFFSIMNNIFNLSNKNLIHKFGDLTIKEDRDVKGLFSIFPNQISLNEKELKKGAEILSRINVTKKDKIVCLIVRDDKYLKQEYKNRDWTYHKYRDCNIENYITTCKYLSDKGYKVFRMGKFVNNKISISNKNIIDYPFSQIKSDFMDIYLAYKCEFCISTGLGYDAVPAIFRKPIVYTNIIPIGCLWTFSSKYIAILKHLIFKKNNNYLSTSQHFTLDIDNADNFKSFDEKGLIILENNEQDILNVVKEMLLLIEDKFSSNSINHVNSKEFWDIYKKNIFKKYKSYEHYGNFVSNLSKKFIENYPNYLN